LGEKLLDEGLYASGGQVCCVAFFADVDLYSGEVIRAEEVGEVRCFEKLSCLL